MARARGGALLIPTDMSFLDLPPWEGMHPLVVHAPLALLFFAPLLAAAHVALGGRMRGLALAVLLAMAGGTVGAAAAVLTGEATADAVRVDGPAEAVLERHEELAEPLPWVFGGLTLVYGVLAFVPGSLARDAGPRPRLVLHGAFLLAWTGALVFLAEAGHHGGRLVHEFGVRAPVAVRDGGAPPRGDRDPDGEDGGGRRRGRRNR